MKKAKVEKRKAGGEDAAKLSNLMEEACSSAPAFWKDKKINY